MLSPLDLSLINGPIPVTATVAGVLALVALAIRKNRTWWTRIVPAVVLACTALTAGLKLLVDHVWKPWPEPLPPILAVWAGAALLAVCLAVARLRTGRWCWRLLSVVLVLVVMTSSVTAANAHFGFYPTSRAVLELLTNNRVDLDEAAKPASSVIEVPAGGKLADVWQKPADLPEKGTVSEAPIPGSFKARPAWIYLPPAYAATPRPRLPVVVLLPGQPGSPRDWFEAGRLTERLDAFAHEHDGLAPIVVVADQLGARMANPLCLNSKLGRSETYLAREVPEWIKRRLTVDERREAWTIAGLSQGGTCAVQLAVRAPDVYGNFINVTGQREPTLGSRAETVKARVRWGRSGIRARQPDGRPCPRTISADGGRDRRGTGRRALPPSGRRGVRGLSQGRYRRAVEGTSGRARLERVATRPLRLLAVARLTNRAERMTAVTTGKRET